MKCQFCGYEFDKPDISACSGCGKLNNCKMHKCPNCGYEIVIEPKIIRFLRGIYENK